MKISDYSSHALGQPQSPELPDDFARSVVVKARAIRRHRKVRGRIAASLALLFGVAVLPFAHRIDFPLGSGAGTRADDALVAYRQATDQTDALRLAEAANPDVVGDYLMPNTSALTRFVSADSDASWDYDPDWASSSDTTVGS